LVVETSLSFVAGADTAAAGHGVTFAGQDDEHAKNEGDKDAQPE
jgi:hypothetical protein